ncbi:hypothetical protein [Methanoculleus chikugoensis]|uniref:hypothetical protein n=1 Tax=Methanoculleus chikugoensis TaxID=118126 RepID=UPI000A574744|nr:hypothetical protein [Methanoculleus chikugoensis]
MGHTADYGAPPEGGGVIGKVVTGRGLLDRLADGDQITGGVERVFRRVDRSHVVVTHDSGFPLEDGMQIVSYVEAEVQGSGKDGIDTGTARSVEHFLLSVQGGRFRVGSASSTYVADTHLVPTRVPAEFSGPRLEGAVTVRTAGKSSGGVYIYTQGVSASPAHTVVGRVVHGIELVRFAGEGDLFAIHAEPEQFDLVGLSLAEAEAVAARRGCLPHRRRGRRRSHRGRPDPGNDARGAGRRRGPDRDGACRPRRQHHPRRGGRAPPVGHDLP